MHVGVEEPGDHEPAARVDGPTGGHRLARTEHRRDRAALDRQPAVHHHVGLDDAAILDEEIGRHRLRLLSYQVSVRVGPAELEEAPEIAHVVARPGIDVRVEDLVLLVARARHDPALRIYEQCGAEVVAVGWAADVLAHLVHAADVEHVGDGVSPELDLPDVANPVAIGRGRDEEEMRALHAEHARRLREVTVVADEDPDLQAERGVEDGKSKIARLEEEPLVSGRLPRRHGAEDLRDRHLAVLADQAAVRADHHRGVVEHAAVVLVEGIDDHGPGLAGDLAQPIDRGAGHRLRGLEPLLVAIEAEVDRLAELREAHHLGPVAGGLSGEVLRLLDVDVLVNVAAELGESYPNAHHNLLTGMTCPSLEPLFYPESVSRRKGRPAGAPRGTPSRLTDPGPQTKLAPLFDQLRRSGR